MTGTEKKSGTTHFGYKQVSYDEKEHLVADVFHSVASKYDIMNDIMSMGLHRIWKRFTVELSAVRSGHQVLDIAGGTGDLAKQFARLVGDEGRVVLADINESMLKVGRNRLIDNGIIDNIKFVQADATCLPFTDNTFDCVTISFGLRNVIDKEAALCSMLRVLRPGGRLLILEFSKTHSPFLSKIYDAYSFKLLPIIGKLVAGDADSYRYLAESIRMHPDQETLEEMMKDAGFVNTGYHNMTGGIVALHKGIKP
ncbi:MAG: bifunctional demethylmenaquinone methyltransferase/2-methoxy-6-polyprenyl-1,4-benzoquinol methylase UbiE [Candidatus Endonucleobacter bathymodioli]|uniref:Ubiquinone/menaquinone biosynthesis C-methyltransferase UbiE n=1 Tax=Candidatus Endonucleibacter bathymodioli TaxID=539814 RepID=A0AA90SS35_9GAMM|nr:bifunctional demethylmenaquinone methyltransferase/2-methoxy-6-polyprenyl-1,4-benzoquinol methylase UbiE [Candidatus Endonucleobacter bathymodioli]